MSAGWQGGHPRALLCANSPIIPDHARDDDDDNPGTMMIIPDHARDSSQAVRALNKLPNCTNLRHSFRHSVTLLYISQHFHFAMLLSTHRKLEYLSVYRKHICIGFGYNAINVEKRRAIHNPFQNYHLTRFVGWGDPVKRLQMIIPSLPPPITTCLPYHTITTCPPYPAYHTISYPSFAKKHIEH